MKIKLAAWVIATSLAVSGMAMAAESANVGALASGQPAGVKQAQSFGGSHQLLWVVGGGLVVGGIVLVATGNGHGTVGSTCPLAGCTSPSTTTTTPATTTTATN